MVRIISPFLCFIVETPRVGRITVPQIRPRSNARYLLACSVQFSRSVASDYLWPHELQHTRVPCPSPTPGACSNSCPSSQWYYPTISSSSAGKDRKAGEEGDARGGDGYYVRLWGKDKLGSRWNWDCWPADFEMRLSWVVQVPSVITRSLCMEEGGRRVCVRMMWCPS